MAQSSNRDINVALAYHEATKHSYTSVRSDAHLLDWSNRPLPYKIYPGAGTLALPRDLSLSQISTLSALRRRSDSAQKSVDLETVTRLLFCADGLTRQANVGGEDYHFRAAASAGALYPVEIYLVAGEIEGMEPGLYHLLPADLKLHGLRRGDWRALPGRLHRINFSPPCSRSVYNDQHLLAQRLEVPRARLPLLLLGYWNDAREPAGSGERRSARY